MNEVLADALTKLDSAVNAIDEAVISITSSVSDTEPAPVSVVLLRTADGRVHRGARIAGIDGTMTYEADNLDDAVALHDLSAVPDDADLCRRCFGPVDSPEDVP
jgi:hypothetical protein